MSNFNCLVCPERQKAVEKYENLEKAMETRAVIEQAKGIMMGRYNCSPSTAFRILRKISNETNVKLHRVCEELVKLTSEAPQEMAG